MGKNIDTVRLARILRLRKYDELETLANEMIECVGWPSFSETISTLFQREGTLSYVTHNEKDYTCVSKPLKFQESTSHSLGVYKGIIRDGHIWLLGLDAVRGIDVDIHEAFGHLNPSNVHELRTEAMTIAVELLTSQIKEMNTYFLDFEEMATSPFAGLVPLVVEARMNELKLLSRKPSISDASKTYYGLMMFTNISFKQKGGGLEAGAYRGFSDFLSQQRGESLDLHGKMAKSNIGFNNCSRESADLLNEVISMFIRGFKTRCYTIDKLGRTGDSRIIPWYLARLKGLSGDHLDRKRKFPSRRWSSPDLIYTHEVDAILVALGIIGRPELHDVVAKYAKMGWKSAIWALSNIRSQKSVETMMNLAMSDQATNSHVAYCNLWRTEDSGAVQYLYKEFQDEKSKRRPEAMRSLALSGEPTRNLLLQHSEAIGEIFAKKPKDTLAVLQAFPELLDNESIEQAVVNYVSRGPSKRMALLMQQSPKLFSKQSVLDAFWEKTRTATARNILDFIFNAPSFHNAEELKAVLEKRADDIISIWKRQGYRYRRYRYNLFQPVFLQVNEIAECIAQELIDSSQSQRYINWTVRRNIDTLLRASPNNVSGKTRKTLEKIRSQR